MSGAVELLTFESRNAASDAAAGLLAGLVKNALDSGPVTQASLVVSGGSTPGRCFELLSRAPLDWSRVTVVPSDERWVPADGADSNERLIRSRLLTGRAEAGSVLPFYRAGIEAAEALPLIERDLSRLQQPFCATLLGMGEDGHFASLFPDFDGLQMALDPGANEACALVRTAGSPHLRISLTLSALLNTRHTVLLIFGEAKRAVYAAALAGGSAYPAEALLRHARAPLTVIWAP